MNIEALFAIGTLSLILGLCLYIPARLWIRRKANRDAKLPTVGDTLTPLGIAFMLVFVATLLLAFSVEYWVPSSIVDRVPTGSLGRLLLVGIAVGVWVVAEKTLGSLGIKLARAKSGEPSQSETQP